MRLVPIPLKLFDTCVYSSPYARPVTARYSNAGSFVTSGAIVAGGHQISFAQANHHRTSGPRVSLVGLSFYYLSSGCVATSAATKPAALQHTIWYYI